MWQGLNPFFVDRTMLISFLVFFLTYLLFGIDGFYFGKTDPDIIKKLVNSSFDITCSINLSETAGLDSSYLSIHYANYTVDSKYIKVLNATTIQFTYHNAPVMKRNYTCKLNNTDNVGQTEVLIGYKPGNVSNFKCRSHKWESMNCSFNDMPNPIATHYTLKYRRRLEDARYQHECNLQINYNRSRFCIIDNSNTTYLQALQNYYFTLDAHNVLGEFQEEFVIDHYASVIPHAPQNLHVESVTANSAVLTWQLSLKLAAFPKPFVHQINITSEYDDWQTVDGVNIDGNTTKGFTLLLTNLKFAFARYDVRIRVRVAASENIDEMWSDTVLQKFRTSSRIPERPPEVDIGGFHISDNQDVVIYWKNLPLSLQNGPNVHYRIKKVLNTKSAIGDTTIFISNGTMAKCSKLLDSEYEFHISSANSDGVSQEQTIIEVPNKENRLPFPTKLKKVIRNGEYLFEWEPPAHNAITDYTVFWCVVKNEMPNQCEPSHSIDFQRLPKNVTRFKLKSHETINFAISANSKTSTSGMVWILCTSADSNDIGKVKTIWISRTTASTIDIQWTVDCVDSAIVRGFNITYCLLQDDVGSSTCEEPIQFEIVNTTAEGINKFTINNLKPYTMYRTSLSMFSDTRMGPSSDMLFNKTLEAPPSAPKNLKARDITNTTVQLFWDRPTQINGALMYYEVWYNDQKLKVEASKNDIENIFLLKNLSCFTNYQTLVQACTIACSEASNTVSIKTEIGTPGQVSQVYAENPNLSDLVVINWRKPALEAGNLDYYELKTVFTTATGHEEVTHKIRGTHTSCRLSYPMCDQHSNKYEFYIRSVNFLQSPHAGRVHLLDRLQDRTYDHNYTVGCDQENENLQGLFRKDAFGLHMQGMWSQPFAYHCNYGHNWAEITYYGIVAMVIVTFVFLLVMCWLEVKKMKNIKVILPEGMQDIVYANDNEMHLGFDDNDDSSSLTKLLEKRSSYDKIVNKNDLQTLQGLGKNYDKKMNIQLMQGSDWRKKPELIKIQDGKVNKDLLKFVHNTSDNNNNTTDPFITIPSTGEIQSCRPVHIEMLENASSPTNNKHALNNSIVYATLNPPNVIDSRKPQNANGYVDTKFLTTNGGYVSNFSSPSKSNETMGSLRSSNVTSSLALNDDSIITSTVPVITNGYTAMLDKKSKNAGKADLDISGYVKPQQLADFGQRILS